MVTEADRGANLRFAVRALKYPNYRLFFAGQIVSLVGTWLTMVASSWLVYRLASTSQQPAAWMLGLVGFAGQIPVFLLAPAAGVWVDRLNRHRILMVTQTLSMVQSFSLAALTLSDLITIPELIALNAFQGLVNSFDVPARQSLAVEMVENRDDLSNAIALNSSMVHSARLVGPAIAGYLIYAVGEGYCFLIDGFSYLAVIVALAAMRLKPFQRPTTTLRSFESFLEGLRYAYGFRPIRAILLLVAVTSLVSMALSTLMPIFAAQVLDGSERTLGWLLGASGLGALAASLYLASRRTVVGLGRVIAMACAALGTGMVLFSFSGAMVFSLPLLMLTGFGLVATTASANTVLQTLVDDDKRGRVMALFTMAFLGIAPLGSLLGGGIATLIGAPWAVTIAGVVCLVGALVFALQLPSLRPLIRPIYQAKGILPQVAKAIQQTDAISSMTRE